MANTLLIPDRFKKNYIYNDNARTRSLSQLVDDLNLSFDKINVINNRRGAQNKAADFNITLLDEGNLFLVDCSAGAVNAQLPSAAVVGIGFEVGIKRIDVFIGSTLGNAALFVPFGAETIDGIAAPWGSYFNGHTVWLRSDGINWRIVAEANAVGSFGGPASYTITAGSPGIDSAGELVQTEQYVTTLNAVSTHNFSIVFLSSNYRLIATEIGVSLTAMSTISYGNLTVTGFDSVGVRVTNGGGGAVTNPAMNAVFTATGRWK